MRFTKVLHPEIILNRRGPEEIRQFYKALAEITVRMGNGLAPVEEEIRNSPLHQSFWGIVSQDMNMIRHLLHCSLFREQPQAKTYHIGKDFALALSKIDKDIPIDVLPANEICYISFPEDTISDEDGPIQGGYVWLGTAGAEDIRKNETSWLQPGQRYISISYLNSKPLGIGFPVTTVTAPLIQTTFDELITELPWKDHLNPNKPTA